MKKLLSVILALSIAITFSAPSAAEQPGMTFHGMDDPRLLDFVKEAVYDGLLGTFDSDEYYVEDVQVYYRSQRYLDMQAFNAKEPVYFGYKLSELDAQFQGQPYVFTVDENGKTIAIPFDPYVKSDADIFRNLAIGAGIILIEVTVFVLTDGVATAAIHAVVGTALQGSVTSALRYGALSGTVAAVITGVQTGDVNAAIEAGVHAASEGFKWGAIAGLESGLDELLELSGATMNGLTMNEAALLQRSSKLPLDFIKSFHSVDEFEIYQKAGLRKQLVDGKPSFIRDIDLFSTITDANGNTMSNAQRILRGLSPVDPSGVAYELHHIGQLDNSPLAILTKAEHMQGGNNSILHWRADSQVSHGADWAKTVQSFWTSYLNLFGQ